MEAPPPRPPSGMDYNAFRRWRTDNGIKGTRQELKDAWDAYDTKKVSATRTKTSAGRGRKTSPKPVSPPKGKTPPLKPPSKGKSPPKPQSPRKSPVKASSPKKSPKKSPGKSKSPSKKSPPTGVTLTNARLFEPKRLKGEKGGFPVWQFTFRYGVYSNGRQLDVYRWDKMQPSMLQQRVGDAIGVLDIIGKVRSISISQVRDVGVLTVELNVADVDAETFVARVERALRHLEVPLTTAKSGTVPDTLVALIPVEIPDTRPYPPETTNSFRIVTSGYEVEDRTNLLNEAERRAREIVLIPKLVKERLGEPTRYGGMNDDYTAQWVFAFDTETLALIDYVVPSASNPPKMSWKQTTPLTFLLSGGTGMSPSMERELRRLLTRDLTYPPSPTPSQAPTLILSPSPTIVSATSPARKSPTRTGSKGRMPGSHSESTLILSPSPTGKTFGTRKTPLTEPMTPEVTLKTFSRSPKSGVVAPPPSKGSKSPKKSPPKRVDCYADVTLEEMGEWYARELKKLPVGGTMAEWSIYSFGGERPGVYVLSSKFIEMLDGYEYTPKQVSVLGSKEGYKLVSTSRTTGAILLPSVAPRALEQLLVDERGSFLVPDLKTLTSIISSRPGCKKSYEDHTAKFLFALYKTMFKRLSPVLADVFVGNLWWEDYKTHNIANVVKKLEARSDDRVLLLAQLRMIVGYFSGLREPLVMEKSAKVTDVAIFSLSTELKEVLVNLQDRYAALKRAAR